MTASQAVFLSYASQDLDAASKLCTAMRAAGIDVWFDHSELRGGDVWDQKIRKQIRECHLFIPIISATTRSRTEGYFRLEWKLAVDRSHLISADRAFLLPVVIDDTTESDARVPDVFRDVQWTRLRGGDPGPVFLARIVHLLQSDDPATRAVSGSELRRPAAASVHGSARYALWALALALIAAGGLLWGHFGAGIQRPPVTSAKAAVSDAAAAGPKGPPTPAAAFVPPPHSVAVLPFVNMSADPKDDYFSDGLSEELLNDLAIVRELKVAARTSSFTFKGKNLAVADIARQLNVGAILEGTVRRSRAQVRISMELIDATTGFQLWAKTYDRDLTDVLRLQSEIAGAVGAALKVRLLQSDSGGSIIGGTADPRAFDAYLRGEGELRKPLSKQTNNAAMADYDAAIALDPQYANAWVGRAMTLDNAWADAAGTTAESSTTLDDALAAGRKAAELAPTLGIAQSIIGHVLAGKHEFAAAAAAYERGMELSPGDARVYVDSAAFLAFLGRFDAAIDRARRAVDLDPLNAVAHASLGYVFLLAGHYPESIESSSRAVELQDCCFAKSNRGLAYVFEGHYEAARASCESAGDYWGAQVCLAIVYDKLALRVDAEKQRARLQTSWGNSIAYQLVEIYAQWGDRARALEWLDKARLLRDPGLVRLKVDKLLDPIRAEPQFQALVAKMNFPD